MDALKSAGRAIIKSPGVPRHTWGTSKHEKLPENWTDTKETLLEGMVFNVKYLGMTLVGQPKGEDMASAAIHRIVATARAGAKKFRKVTLTVSPKGIIITDTETTDLIENVSIYRISYCTADKTQDKVFAYVSQSQFNETLECHAFLCQKKKIAQAVTLTVAQAFKVALDLWEIAQEGEFTHRGELMVLLVDAPLSLHCWFLYVSSYLVYHFSTRLQAKAKRPGPAVPVQQATRR
uniref:Si:dkey-71h2.2 n=1 Tax=Echeneis naucrates TaxID=173247 RepID=A0A665UZI2_ECHNA